MSKKQWETVMLSKQTKQKLQELKVDKSYDTLIDAMISYFITTGYDPFTAKATPATDIRREIDRLAADYLLPIKESIEQAQKGRLQAQSTQIQQAVDGIRQETRGDRNKPNSLTIERKVLEYYLKKIEDQIE